MDFPLSTWQLSHVVNNSWLPITMSWVAFSGMVNVLLWLKTRYFNTYLCLSSVVCFGLFLSMWMRDIIREGTFQGHHTTLVQSGLKWGLVWFLFSEAWFFFSIFWAFFHMSVSPFSVSSFEWPTLGIVIIPFLQVPLLNTIVLLMSGVTATLAHQMLVANKSALFWMVITIFLGLYFLGLQSMEYVWANFSMSSSVFGSVFFFGTGFHGSHVCLGTIMLISSAIRMAKFHVTSFHHFGVEFTLWYWHFVDVVWLFLYTWVYFWGS